MRAVRTSALDVLSMAAVAVGVGLWLGLGPGLIVAGVCGLGVSWRMSGGGL